MTAPDEGGGAVWSIVLGVVLGLMVQTGGFILSYIVLYLAVRAGVPRSTVTATLVLNLVEVGAWFVAGAVAFEIARRRLAVVVTALVPPLIALYVFALGVIIGQSALGSHAGVVALSWVALTAVAYLGGRWWERHIRRPGPVE
ncbi:MAG TPA: hypothetical protein VJ787_07550 [Thermoleophilia bacterium]|nr:hypothetical protein [Thermoleophilia bacterium]